MTDKSVFAGKIPSNAAAIAAAYAEFLNFEFILDFRLFSLVDSVADRPGLDLSDEIEVIDLEDIASVRR